MKQIVLFFAVLCMIPASYAQVGLQAGVNSSDYKYILNGVHGSRDRNWGFNGALVFRSRGKNVCVQPTFSYTQKGATNPNVVITNVPDTVISSRNKLEYVQFSMPVLMKVKLASRKNSFDIGFGPYVSRLVSAVSIRKFTTGGSGKTDFKIGSGSGDTFKGTDYGLSFYVGLKLDHFNVNAGYDLGLADIGNSSAEKIKNGCLSLNIGVFLFK
ncbi:MAG: hypothetical protein K0Q79_1407 [Flavipsychrobacter sp.]|jgi:hypothetical protein|nr:hypothetical protein [Flavipsychrobacter sp.]